MIILLLYSFSIAGEFVFSLVPCLWPWVRHGSVSGSGPQIQSNSDWLLLQLYVTIVPTYLVDRLSLKSKAVVASLVFNFSFFTSFFGSIKNTFLYHEY